MHFDIKYILLVWNGEIFQQYVFTKYSGIVVTCHIRESPEYVFHCVIMYWLEGVVVLNKYVCVWMGGGGGAVGFTRLVCQNYILSIFIHNSIEYIIRDIYVYLIFIPTILSSHQIYS